MDSAYLPRQAGEYEPTRVMSNDPDDNVPTPPTLSEFKALEQRVELLEKWATGMANKPPSSGLFPGPNYQKKTS